MENLKQKKYRVKEQAGVFRIQKKVTSYGGLLGLKKEASWRFCDNEGRVSHYTFGAYFNPVITRYNSLEDAINAINNIEPVYHYLESV